MSTMTAPVRSKHWPKTFPDHLPVPETSLWMNLQVTARRYPTKAAYVFFGKTLTFGELHEAAVNLSNWLLERGFAKGDRFSLYMQNSPAFPIVFYALMRFGGIAVPINPMCKQEELAYFVSDSASRVIFCADDLAPIANRVRGQQGGDGRLIDIVSFGYGEFMQSPQTLAADERPTSDVERWLRTPADETIEHYRLIAILATAFCDAPHTSEPGDIALIAYTSGTTGFPKGCIHTHSTLMANAVIGYWNNTTAGAVSLAAVPLFHITGLLYYTLANVFVGMMSVLMNRWDKDLASNLIKKYRISHWTCIPTMVVDVFGDERYKNFGFDILKYMSGGGTSMPKAIAKRLQDEFDLGFVEGYGLTETAAGIHINLPLHPRQQCLGVPIVGVTSLVIDADTGEPLPAHAIGEIVTASPTVFKGYWNKPDDTAKAFLDIGGRRYFRTGDIGYFDDDGHFYLTDRSKRMINASGYKVWPAEVEALFYGNEHVKEVCVIAVKDDYRGECVKALVVLKPESTGSITPNDLTAWAKAHMAAYKAPKLIEFRASLPKSGSGKIMWRELQDAEKQ